MQNSFSEHPGRFILRQARELVIALGLAFVASLFLDTFVAHAVSIDQGPSMQPNLYRGDRVLIEKISLTFRAPQRGDIVVANRPGEPISVIKRVVAVRGERVAVRGGHVWINDAPLAEPWVTYFGGPDYPALIVPPDHVFIVGDNRAESRDSRTFGPVRLDEIEGRVLFIYWPPGHIGLAP
ncbi:MAG: signal peptidase I [Chloroflexota bacterium]